MSELAQPRGVKSIFGRYLSGGALNGTRAAPTAQQAAAPVRRATVADIDEIVGLCAAAYAEGHLRGVVINERKLKGFLSEAMQDPERCCLVSQSGASRIEGVIVGFVTQDILCDEKCAWNQLVFVRPQPRGSTIAYRLWAVFGQWAKSTGATTLYCGMAVGIVPERTRRFYADAGMTEVGPIYRLALG